VNPQAGGISSRKQTLEILTDHGKFSAIKFLDSTWWHDNNEYDNNPLHWAVYHQDTALTKYIIEKNLGFIYGQNEQDIYPIDFPLVVFQDLTKRRKAMECVSIILDEFFETFQIGTQALAHGLGQKTPTAIVNLVGERNYNKLESIHASQPMINKNNTGEQHGPYSPSETPGFGHLHQKTDYLHPNTFGIDGSIPNFEHGGNRMNISIPIPISEPIAFPGPNLMSSDEKIGIQEDRLKIGGGLSKSESIGTVSEKENSLISSPKPKKLMPEKLRQRLEGIQKVILSNSDSRGSIKMQGTFSRDNFSAVTPEQNAKKVSRKEQREIKRSKIFVNCILYVCTYKGNIDLIKELINELKSEPFEVIPHIGRSSFHLALKVGNYDVVEYFIQHAKKQDSEVLSRMIQITTASLNGPLHIACMFGHTKVWNLLIKHGFRDHKESDDFNLRGWVPFDLIKDESLQSQITTNMADLWEKFLQKHDDGIGMEIVALGRKIKKDSAIEDIINKTNYQYCIITRKDTPDIRKSIIYKQLKRIQEKWNEKTKIEEYIK
jgi:ankyrin repeat protein